MPRTSKIKSGIRTSSILKLLALLVLWVLVMAGLAWIVLPRQGEERRQKKSRASAPKAAALLAAQTRHKLERPPLQRAGEIIHSGNNGSLYSITWQGNTDTDLIIAEKTISDFWKDLGNLDVKIEYPDHAVRGERVRLFASSGDTPLMAVLLAGKETPPDDDKPPPSLPEPAKPKPGPQKKEISLFPEPAANTGKIVIIIDDIGFNLTALDNLLQIKVPLTLAVLPHACDTSRAVRKIKQSGAELMLHLPMQPVSYPESDPGKDALLKGMSQREVKECVLKALEAVPGASGVNNHMGSAFTADPEGVEKLLVVLKEKGLFYVDSRTTIDTVGFETARLMEVPAAQRDVFLDHRRDLKSIKLSLVKLARTANKQNIAVAIGHPHPETIKVLTRYLPKMAKMGYRFSYASEAVR